MAPIYSFAGDTPDIHPSVFVAPTASIIGRAYARGGRPGPGSRRAYEPPRWLTTPQTAFSPVVTAPSAQPAVKETSSPARKIPRCSAGSPSCLKWVKSRCW